MVEAGGLEPLIAVLAMENTKQTLLAVLDALRKVLQVGHDHGNESYEGIKGLIEKHKGLDHMEKLQYSCSVIVYKKIVALMEDFFDVIEEEETLASDLGVNSALALPKQLFKLSN